jgi:vitamin B12 transporter
MTANLCRYEEEMVRYLAKLTPAVLLAATMLSAPVMAQDVVERPVEVDNINGSEQDDTIIVSGTPQSRGLLPASVADLSQQDLERLQSPALADILATIPGVSVSRNGPIGGLTGVRIRGAESAQTLVVIDDVRVGDPTSPGGGFDFGNLLSVGIANVDILRGSNSVVWGSDAIGGVVLVETGGAAAQLVEYGSHDTKSAQATFNVGAGPIRLSAGGGWFDTDGISAARSGTEADGFRQYRGQATLVASLADTLEFSANVLYADSRLDIDGFAPPTFSFGDTAEFQAKTELYASARVEHRLGDFVSRFSFALADINRDTFDPATGNAPTFTARGRSERISWQGQYGSNEELFSVLVGADHEWSRSLTGDAFSSDRGRTAITGFFGHANLRPFSGLRLGIGARFDDHRRFGGDASLSAHGLYDVAPGLSLRAGYSEGFKAPTLFQLSPTPTGFGNPLLEPEESTAYEIGFIFRRSGELAGAAPFDIRVEGSLYRRDSRNLIDFVSCFGPAAPPICGSGTRPFGTYANIDRARAQGGELEVTLMPSTRLSVTAGYAYTATRDRTAGNVNFGNRLARRPVHSAIAGFDYTGIGFALGADIRLVGDSFDNASNVTRLDGYILANLRGSLEITDQFELFGRIENLFDADYQTVAGYGTYGRTASVGIRARL